MTQSTTFSDVSSLLLPNGQSYTFGYDGQWGLVNSITYPTGGKVTYTWGVNSLSESYNGATPDVWTSVTLNGGKKNCYFEYDLPAVTKRVVSFDGVHPALEQDFAYSTQPGTNGFWSSKTTTVTTKDLVRGNTTAVTIYNYIPMFPPLIATGTSAQSVIPHESSVLYQDGSGNTLRTVIKVWTGVDLLGAECEILANGMVSGKFYQYQPSLTAWSAGTDQVTDLAEYDYTQGVTSACTQPASTTAPARETKTQYATIPSSVLWQPALSAAIPQTNDRPSVVQVYDHGTLIAETDIAYDQTSVSSVSPAAYNHDETNLGAGQVAGRGNATTITKKCIQNCSSNSVTTAQYDETGQIAAVTDPNGNTTKLSYTDNYSTGGTPPGNTNTYVTTITRPATNGVNHISSFAYHYTFGELTSATDENLQVSTYQYNDTWGRPTLGGAPDGGQTQKVYNDSAPSPTVTTCQLINGTAGATCLATSPPTGWKTTLATMDGVGQVVQNALVSDPDGITYTATTYDGLGRKYTSTNPYRGTGDSTYGITAYTYDALGRTTVVQQPDGSKVQTAYDQPCIASANGDGATVTDETGRLRESCSDGLGRLIEVDESGAGATTAIAGSGTVTIGGSEQTRSGSPGAGSATVVLSGSGCVYISQHGVYYAPSGSVSITVKGVNVGTGTAAWSGSCNQGNGALTINPTLSGIASDLASSLTGSGAGVTATSNGATIQIVANTSGSGTNYSVSSSYTLSTGVPSGSPYVSATVPATLTGGGSAAVTDSGTVSITVDGFTATASFGSGTTAQEIASSLTSSLNAGSPVEASVSGTLVKLTALDFGSGSNYTLSTSDTWNSTDFTEPSFTATPSGATLTGGVSGSLGNSPLVTLYTYDALNDLTCAVQKGTDTTAFSGCASASATWRPRSFVYDSLSRLTSATNPESGTDTYAYDANGNVTTRVEPKANTTNAAVTTSTYSYDALNRLLSKVHADPIDANSYYGYDGTGIPSCNGPVPPTITSPTNLVGRRSGMCTNKSASSWSYDPIGRPLVEARANIGPPIEKLNTIYAYYKDGSLNTLTYPSGDVLTYTVGGAGRPLAATDSTNNYVTAATYAPQGAPATMDIGSDNVVTNNVYNDRLQPILFQARGVQICVVHNPPIQCEPPPAFFSLCYDFHLGVAVSSPPCTFNAYTTGDNGNVFQILNNVDSTRSAVFTYDSLNRISQANTINTTSANCWGELYTIDAWGNLTNRSAPSGMSGSCLMEALSATATNLNRLGGIGLLYDGAGNVTTDNLGNTYTYDAENRISTVGGYTYSYDADGTRMEKTTGSSGTMYWLGPGGETLTEASIAGTINEEYIYFDGERIARVDRPSGTVNYYFSNHLGSASVIATVGSGGTVSEQTDYFPFGGIAYTSGSDPNHYKFTGKERDSESGLDNFTARYNASTMGRFMTPDPSIPFNLKRDKFEPWISNPQHWNKYAYALNNPLLYVDPSGMTETIYYWLNSSLTEDQRKYFQEHKTEILNAIASKLKKAGIKDVVFKEGSTLSNSQVKSMLQNQPKGVAFLNFANKSYAGINAPPDQYGVTDLTNARSAVFVGNLQAGNPSAGELSFRISEVSDHELGHGMGFYSRGPTMSFIEFWNRDLMNEGQGMPTRSRQFDMSNPQNLQAVDEINKQPEH
jgi:RHS repeat-associated protein